MSSSPTIASIKSLAQWNTCFHPTDGVFRNAARLGASLHTLEIDLRYVDESHIGKSNRGNTIYLPSVCTLILRGGEYCQDDEKRVDCLVEVLDAVNPVEFKWLHGNGNPEEDTFSLSTHMVHQAIINAGKAWTNLRIQEVQGGYPCPNFFAPTPFAITPGHTPLPSPGLSHAPFSGMQGMASMKPTSSSFPHDRSTISVQPSMTSIPTISAYKTRHVDPVKLAQRVERHRISQYALKPRFDYAFGSWAPEVLKWNFEGRYTTAAIKTIMTSLIKAFTSTFPSSCEDVELDLPSLFSLNPVPVNLISELHEFIIEAKIPVDVVEYLQDVTFISIVTVGETTQFARLFDESYEGDDRDRLGRRLKAEMLLANDLASSNQIVSLSTLTGTNNTESLGVVPTSVDMVSPAYSCASLTNDTDYAPSEPEAMTPDFGNSEILEPGIKVGASKSRSPSVEVRAGGDGVKNGGNALGMGGVIASIMPSAQ